jgi:hypothetical protein
MRTQTNEATVSNNPRDGIQRRMTQLPRFEPTAATSGAPTVGARGVNDGVFGNLDAKPEVGEKTEELPPVRSATY